jgi:hypothetical protein
MHSEEDEMLDDSPSDLSLIEFTAQDRCDQCGAQAYTMARKPEARSELLFCRHHRRDHYQLLLDEGWVVIDDVAALEELQPYKAPV